jgi:hypothetical protein
MLFKEIIAVYTENHTKHINTIYWQNTELLFIITGGTYGYHWAFKVNTHIKDTCMDGKTGRTPVRRNKRA